MIGDEHVDAAPAARRDLDGGRDRALGVVRRGVERDEDRLVLGLVVDDRLGDRDLDGRRSGRGPGGGGSSG